MYENLKLGFDFKLLFMVTGAYYESGLCFCSLSRKTPSNMGIALVFLI